MIDRAHIKATTSDSPNLNNNTPLYIFSGHFASFKRDTVLSEKMRVTSTIAAGGTD